MNKGVDEKIPGRQYTIPEWLLGKDNVQGATSRKRSVSFIHRTLKALAGFIQQELIIERFAAGKGLLQQVDPRLKLVSILFFMVIAGASQQIASLLILAAAAAVLAYLSGLEMPSFFKRVWLAIPLLVLVFSVPATTNLLIAGHPLIIIYTGFYPEGILAKLPQELYFSVEGINVVVRTVIRIGTSISYAYLLVMTTRWSDITRSLRVLGIPKFVTALLDMTYRYIFVFVNTAVSMFEARLMRTVGQTRPDAGRKFISSGVGMLFIKSGQMGEHIYDAMVCRCFTGEPVSLKRFRFTSADGVWLVAAAFIAFTALIFQIAY